MELPHFMAAEGKMRFWAVSVRSFAFVKMLHDSAPASTSAVLVSSASQNNTASPTGSDDQLIERKIFAPADLS